MKKVQYDILSPIYEENYNRIIQSLNLSEGIGVLDIGCGYGKLLIDTCSMYNTKGIGIDIDSDKIVTCKKKYNKKNIKWINTSILEYSIQEKYEFVVCFGEWYGFPGLKLMRKYLNPYGKILYGRNIWRKEPNEEYINILGIDKTESDFKTIQGNYEEFKENNFVVLYQFINSINETDYHQRHIWDKRELEINLEYQWKYYYNELIREYHGWGVWLLESKT